MSLIIRNNTIDGCTAWGAARPNPYPAMKPFHHASGAAWYVITADGEIFVDDDNTRYPITKRTQAEIESTPEYQAWAHVTPTAWPIIYATLTLTGGDGAEIPAMYPNEDDPTLQTLQVTGAIYADAALTQVIPISYTYRISVLRVVRERFASDGAAYVPEILDAFPIRVPIVNGRVDMLLSRKKEGVYMIDDRTFELVNGARVGQAGTQFRVQLVDGAKFFKVIE